METLLHKTKYLPLKVKFTAVKQYFFDLALPFYSKVHLHRPMCPGKAKILTLHLFIFLNAKAFILPFLLIQNPILMYL